MEKPQLTSYTVIVDLINGKQEKHAVKIDPQKPAAFEIHKFIKKTYGDPPVKVLNWNFHRK